ncbi:hypothetical protein [Mucilaginibacter sp.]|uniref:hypothetical protein n=1 Tax=Mucilaginibacter sp. TaxID=1882438 RepID=UPI002617C29D|nr:hypothetical protein [Mucilaginibacter sp.]
MAISIGRELVAFVKGKATDERAGQDQQIAESLDMLESRFDVSEMGEHDVNFYFV